MLGSEVSFRTASVVRKQLNVLGSYLGSGEDLEAVLNLIAQGKLVPQVATRSLKDFPTVLQNLHEGKYKGRIVLVPEGLE